MRIPSFPKVWALGHPSISDLLAGPVVVQEKIDGSQFSFALLDGELHMRSKSAEILLGAEEKLFAPAVATVKRLLAGEWLKDGWVYRCECVSKPRHNTLCYERVPEGNLVLFDIEISPSTFMAPTLVERNAKAMGVESVATIFAASSGGHLTKGNLDEWLQRTSALGGQKIEGVVIKRYDAFGKDGKALMGKHVSEEFKEIHRGAWREENPTKGDIVARLVESYRTPARWAKVVQHLAESGKLTHSPQDIGPLLGELGRDLKEECEEEIKEALFKWGWKQIARGAQRGFAQWYKEELAKAQFALLPGDVIPVGDISPDPSAPTAMGEVNEQSKVEAPHDIGASGRDPLHVELVGDDPAHSQAGAEGEAEAPSADATKGA